jgi:hypothetical protein
MRCAPVGRACDSAVIMTNNHEELPRPADELAMLAAYYGSHDTSADMADGQLIHPLKDTERLNSDRRDPSR